MWFHILLFLSVPVLAIGAKKGWTFFARMEGRVRRLFWLVLLLGNTLGMCVTISRGMENRFEIEEYALERKEAGKGLYQENLEVISEDGQSCQLTVDIPEQEGAQPEEETETAAEPDFKEEVLKEISRVNEEQGEKDRYLLPESLDGSRLTWRRQRDNSGSMLTALALGTALALALAGEQDKRKKQESRREQLAMDYPGLVMKLALFLEAGMSVRTAFGRMAADYRKRREKTGSRYAYEEIAAVCMDMENGIPEGEAYQRFGQRCNEVRYKTLATLLIQNLKKGNQKLLPMLEQESVTAWEDRKRRAKILGETAATKLLVPMVMMLLVVIAVLLIPACLSFYG